MSSRSRHLTFRLGALRRAALGRRAPNEIAIELTLGSLLLAAAAAVRYVLFLRPEARELLVAQIAAGLVGSSVVLTILPLVPLFPRFSASARPEWPITAFQRIALDLACALGGLWALGFALVSAALIPWDGSVPPAAAVAAVLVALAGTAGLLLLVQLLLELSRASRASRFAAALALGGLFLGLGVSGAGGWPARLLVPADLLASVASGRPWGLSLALSLALAAAPLAIGPRLHWRWLEARLSEPSAPRRSGGVFRWALGTRLLGVRSSASRGLAAQSLVYLARSGRFRFFGLYVLCGAVFLASKLPSAWSPESRTAAVVLWGAAGSGAFYFNLFAFEGDALALLLASPLSGREILRAKQSALFAGSAVYVAVAAAVAVVRFRWPLSGLAAALGLAASFLLLNALIGGALSVLYPRPVDLRESLKGFLPPESASLALVAFAATMALTLGTFLSAQWLAAASGLSWLRLAPPCTLLVATVALYRFWLARLGSFLDGRREALALSSKDAPA